MTILLTGCCIVRSRHVFGAHGRGTLRMPAACLLVRLPRGGYVLVDTGYAPRFHEVTDRWPWRLYRLITPVRKADVHSAWLHLLELGIAQSEIHAIILSHLHADHIAGIKDFPDTPLFSLAPARDLAAKARGFSALRRGFLPPLLEASEHKRLHAIAPIAAPSHLCCISPVVFDVLGDGSILLVPLPGHALGHAGVYIPQTQRGDLFYVADAIWTNRAITHSARPAFPATLLHNETLYNETISRLAAFARMNPQVHLLPAHCTGSIWSLRQAGFSVRGTVPDEHC